MENNRFKNIYFYLGLIGVIFGAAGVDFNTLTSWKLLFEAILGILANPVAILCVVAGILGSYADPTTKGLRDRNK